MANYAAPDELMHLVKHIPNSANYQIEMINKNPDLRAKAYIETYLRLSEINKIRIRIAAEITGKIPTE